MANPELLTGLGAAASIFLSAAGACYASVHSGVYAVRSSGQHWIFTFSPIVISGVLAIYGIIIGVILSGKFTTGDAISETEGYRYFSSGLAVGLACLASGLGIGNFMEKQIPPTSARRVGPNGEGEPLLTGTSRNTGTSGGSNNVNLLLVLVFLEAIGLYGLIVALVLAL